MTDFEKCTNAIQTLLDTVDALTEWEKYDLSERLDILQDRLTEEEPEVIWLHTRSSFDTDQSKEVLADIRQSAYDLSYALDGTDTVTVDMDPDFLIRFRKDLEKVIDADVRISWGD